MMFECQSILPSLFREGEIELAFRCDACQGASRVAVNIARPPELLRSGSASAPRPAEEGSICLIDR
jgi:hypothetical protein